MLIEQGHVINSINNYNTMTFIIINDNDIDKIIIYMITMYDMALLDNSIETLDILKGLMTHGSLMIVL